MALSQWAATSVLPQTFMLFYLYIAFVYDEPKIFPNMMEFFCSTFSSFMTCSILIVFPLVCAIVNMARAGGGRGPRAFVPPNGAPWLGANWPGSCLHSHCFFHVDFGCCWAQRDANKVPKPCKWIRKHLRHQSLGFAARLLNYFFLCLSDA